MHSTRRAGCRAAALCAMLLLAACEADTPARTIVTGHLSLTSVQGPTLPAADDPMLPVLGETARLTLREAGSPFWNVNTFEGSNGSTAHFWQRLWDYTSASTHGPDFEPDASGYLQVVVEPAMERPSTVLVATRFVEEPGVVHFSATISGGGFQLVSACQGDDMRLDADGFPLAPNGLVLPCTVSLCRGAPDFCLVGPGLLEFDLPPASIPTPSPSPPP